MPDQTNIVSKVSGSFLGGNYSFEITLLGTGVYCVRTTPPKIAPGATTRFYAEIRKLRRDLNDRVVGFTIEQDFKNKVLQTMEDIDAVVKYARRFDSLLTDPYFFNLCERVYECANPLSVKQDEDTNDSVILTPNKSNQPSRGLDLLFDKIRS